MNRIIYLVAMISLIHASPATAKTIIGLYEKVAFPVQQFTLKAKIDTGARHSSLHALNIKIYQQNSKDWVSFDTEDDKGKTISFSAPVHRIARVKRHNGVTQKRPVIITSLCIGNILREVEVNLIDRTRFNYRLLVGRSFLEKNFLVDVANEYTQKPNC